MAQNANSNPPPRSYQAAPGLRGPEETAFGLFSSWHATGLGGNGPVVVPNTFSAFNHLTTTTGDLTHAALNSGQSVYSALVGGFGLIECVCIRYPALAPVCNTVVVADLAVDGFLRIASDPAAPTLAADPAGRTVLHEQVGAITALYALKRGHASAAGVGVRLRADTATKTIQVDNSEQGRLVEIFQTAGTPYQMGEEAAALTRWRAPRCCTCRHSGTCPWCRR